MTQNAGQTVKGWGVTVFFAAFFFAINASQVLAWKPSMHITLAEEARRDAVDDGRVSLYRVDHEKGEVKEKLGDYDVDPVILAVLRQYPEQYRAGVIGPDAYPDLITGQQTIHPDTAAGGGSYTDQWFQYLWGLCFGAEGQQADREPQVRAFVLGFLAHGAGDLFAHTFVNYFAGGTFELGENAVRHVVLEGYVAKRAPGPPTYTISIDGVQGFLYRRLIDAPRGSALERLLQGEGGKVSIPRVFSNLRIQVEQDFGRAWLPYLPGWSLYKQAWLKDIDEGLKAWPLLSHALAEKIVLDPTPANVQEARRLAKEFAVRHLLSMTGLPDFIGQGISAAAAVSEAVYSLVPDIVKELARAAADGLDEYLFKKAFGLALDEFKEYVKRPEVHFDRILDRGSPSGEGPLGTPHAIDLETFNTECLNLKDAGPSERFDTSRFPPAYNTVTMTKLLLLPPSEINRLLGDLGSSARLREPNVLLGFIRTLDGDNQWKRNTRKLVFWNDEAAYKQIFMCQTGEEDAACCACGSRPAHAERVRISAGGRTLYDGRWTQKEGETSRVLQRVPDEETDSAKSRQVQAEIRFSRPMKEVALRCAGKTAEVEKTQDAKIFRAIISLEGLKAGEEVPLEIEGKDRKERPIDADPKTIACSSKGAAETGPDRAHRLRTQKPPAEPAEPVPTAKPSGGLSAGDRAYSSSFSSEDIWAVCHRDLQGMHYGMARVGRLPGDAAAGMGAKNLTFSLGDQFEGEDAYRVPDFNKYDFFSVANPQPKIGFTIQVKSFDGSLLELTVLEAIYGVSVREVALRADSKGNFRGTSTGSYLRRYKMTRDAADAIRQWRSRNIQGQEYWLLIQRKGKRLYPDTPAVLKALHEGLEGRN